MKIARMALCDVLQHCPSQLTWVGQGSHVTRGKGPSHGRAIALHGGRWQGSETALISHVSLEKQERMLKMRQLDGPKRTENVLITVSLVLAIRVKRDLVTALMVSSSRSFAYGLT